MKRFIKKLCVLTFLLAISVNVMATDQSFSVSIELVKPITITKTQDLFFPTTVLTGSAVDVVILPADSGAASFYAQGGKSRNITRSVVESGIEASASGVTGTISVDTFVISGPTAFDVSGFANGIKVGATAHILAASADGLYAGTATLRIVYQ